MKQKLFFFFLALVASVGTIFAERVQIGELYYNLDATKMTAEVTYQQFISDNNYSGLTSAYIPSSVTFDNQTFDVQSIANYAFSYCSSLISVSIPNSVTSIGGDSFLGCKGLVNVVVPNSVTNIGGGAFSGVLNIVYSGTATGSPWGAQYVNGYVDGFLVYSDKTKTTLGACSRAATGEMIIPNSVTSIEAGAFQYCSSLTSITIPDNVTRIEDKTFYGCRSLLSFTIPNNVTSIGSEAFYECTNLTTLTIGYAVEDLGDKIFEGCYSLTDVIWNARNYPDFTSSNTPFYHYYSHYNIFDIRTRITSFVFGEGVEYIPAYLCSGMNKLTSITIPNSVIHIGTDAFYQCTNLTNVTIPSSVTNISDNVFDGCSITFVNYLGSINDWCNKPWKPNVISNNYSLSIDGISQTAITIPNSITSIGNYVFSGCSSLTSVTIPDSVTSIGYRAFEGCSSLTSITIGNSVTSIGEFAFFGCYAMKKVIWNAKHYPDLTTSSNTPFYNNKYSSSKLDIRNQITSFVIGDGVEHIPAYLCSGMEQLTSIAISDSVKSIGSYAFYGCSGLTSITIGNSVTNIGISAFSSSDSLHVVWNAINYADFSSSRTPFYYYSDNVDLRWRVSSFELGGKVEHIPAYLCSGMGNLTSITIPNSVTSIGNDAFDGCIGLKSITIPDNVTSIGESAFKGCSALTSVTISNNVTRIEKGTFEGCSGLTSVDIPNSVISIGNSAFSRCSSLTNVAIPNSITSIERYAFSDCTNLTSVTIGSGVTNIGSCAFKGCSSLKNVIWNAKYYPDFTSYRDTPFYNYSDKFDVRDQITSFVFGENVKHIPAYLCRNMKNLTSVIIPEDVTSIGDDAFLECYGLTSVTWNAKNCTSSNIALSHFYCARLNSFVFGDKVEHIPAYLCKNRDALTAITIPQSVKSIGENAFSGCSGLTSITLPKNVTSIGERAFSGCTGITRLSVDKENAIYDSRDSCNAIVKTATNTLVFGCKSTTIPNSVTNIDSYAFDGCRELTGIDIPKSVINIGNSTFNGCSGLTNVTIPNSVTSLGENAFYGCSALTDVIVGNKVNAINSKTFYGCSNLTNILLGASVKVLEDQAFASCPAIETITCYSKRPPTVNNAFSNLPYSTIVYVQADYLDYYLMHDFWGLYDVRPIGAITTPNTELQVTPTETTVDVVWPSVNNAATYELVIQDKDGNIVCTLIFNANGQLSSIAFAAPGRNANQKVQAAGFSFTVTGLDSGTGYDLTITAKDSQGAVLQTTTQSFTTTGGVMTDIDASTASQPSIRKQIKDGQLFILRDGKTYTVQGQEVR